MANSAMDLSASTGIVPSFAEITGFDPYPWQCRLYEALRGGQPPASLDIPTGLGKPQRSYSISWRSPMGLSSPGV